MIPSRSGGVAPMVHQASRPWRRGLAATLVAVVALAGCGGGGGGTVAPLPLISDTAAPYWVSGSGYQWLYRRVDSRPGGTALVLKRIEDAGLATLAGRTVQRFEHGWSPFEDAPYAEYLAFDGRDIRTIEFDGVSIIEYASVPAPLRDGQTVTVFERSEQAALDLDGLPDTVRLEIRVTTSLQPTLTVPAGDFANALKVREEAIATVTLSSTGQSFSANSVLTQWYASGVGIVRRTFEDPNFTAPNNTVVEELVGVDAGTVRAGMVHRTALDTIGNGTSSTTAGPPAFAAGPQGLLVASAAEDGTIRASLHDAAGRRLTQATVLAAASPQRLAGPAVAFDGTDFRVFAVRSDPTSSPSPYAIVGQRVTTSGVLRDPVAGVMVATGTGAPTDTLAALRAAGRQGDVLLAWGRFDGAAYQAEGRLVDASNAPRAGAFAVAPGLPATLATRDDQFLLSLGSASGTVASIGIHTIDLNGALVAGPPSTFATNAPAKAGQLLSSVGSDTWMSWAEYAVVGQAPSALRAARIGRDGVLLDGNSLASGVVVSATQRDRLSAALGTSRSVLFWTEGVSGLDGVVFPTSALTAGQVPVTGDTIPLSPSTAGVAAPAREHLAGATAAGVATALWVDNLQQAGAASDRVSFTMFLPRIAAP